jgi:MtN3 and saliva related transmembrane protein
MSSEYITLIGLAAGTLTTVSFLPQLIKTWQCKSARDLSYAMLLSFGSGVVLWLVYGLYLRALPIILANAVTLALIVAILLLKVRYDR